MQELDDRGFTLGRAGKRGVSALAGERPRASWYEATHAQTGAWRDQRNRLRRGFLAATDRSNIRCCKFRGSPGERLEIVHNRDPAQFQRVGELGAIEDP